jgi:glycosyltransferase involved in cell wall biosynthesis
LQISVIIPTYNRRRLLPSILESWKKVANATLLDFEIIFSDDGSEDGTADFLEEQRDKLPITILKNDHGGASAARNHAIEFAQGERLIFCGDDIYPEPDFVKKHYYLGEELGPEVSILGQVDWHPEQETKYLLKHITELGNEQFSYNRLRHNEVTDFRHFYTCNLSVSRQMLANEQIKFDPLFYKVNFEDTELAYRLSKHGQQILYRDDITAHHYHEYTVEGFCNRQKTAGEMANVILGKHPELREYIHLLNVPELIESLTTESDADRSVGIIEIANKLEEVWSSHIPTATRVQIESTLSMIYSHLFTMKFMEGSLLSPNKGSVTPKERGALFGYYFDTRVTGQLHRNLSDASDQGVGDTNYERALFLLDASNQN